MSTLTVSLSGTDIADIQTTKDFTETEKLEQNIVLVSATQSIDYSYIDDPTVFHFSGNNEFTVAITAGGSTITFNVAEVFTFTTDPVFAATITDITVGEANGVSTTIKVKILNEA